ncbi:hypothetical protein AVEN_35493-1 [Araneus ventricosus]|uniref:Uncharacterized protein n=1 Tax=Araneus ventricosus TaxID=182803 RepID=A0A4Y2IUC1_ARAVE|nr:hypothetical protein AVEN_35493-1 [Araneus ventricosus]
MAETTEIKTSLAKGVIGSFDAAYEDLCKLALLSSKVEWYTIPEAVVAKIMFNEIDENPSEEDLADFFCALKKIPTQKLDFDCDNNIKDFCTSFKSLRDLVERKLSVKSQTWIAMREKERTFSDENEALSEELKVLEEEVERARLQRNRQIAKEAAEEETTQRLLSAAEDFKSQHPFFLKANTKEQLEFIETYNERKLAQLRKDQEKAKKNYEEATLKYRSEIWRVIEETMQTKVFINWLKEKNRRKLKSLQEELDELWNKFKEEMQQSEELCMKYKEVNEICTQILTEKRRKEYVKKRLAATIKLQKHIRRFLARKKEETAN